jgi:molybdopterin synthase catalytic subunit
MTVKVQNYSFNLVDGPITVDYIAEVMKSLHVATNVGAHAFFAGQVKAEQNENKIIEAIEYSAEKDVFALETERTFEHIFKKYNQIEYMHIAQSVGIVPAGQLSFFSLISAIHKSDAFKANEEVVDIIKFTMPVWKKKIYSDGSSVWK